MCVHRRIYLIFYNSICVSNFRGTDGYPSLKYLFIKKQFNLIKNGSNFLEITVSMVKPTELYIEIYIAFPLSLSYA